MAILRLVHMYISTTVKVLKVWKGTDVPAIPHIIESISRSAPSYVQETKNKLSFPMTMPSLSSLLASHKSSPETPPHLTFNGPDSSNHFRALSPKNQLLAHFAVSKDSIWRISSQPPQQICTFSRSSLSGTTTLNIHGQQIKMKQSWEGMQYGKDVKTAAGTLKWRPGSGGTEEFRDAQGVILARGKMPGMLSKRVYPLEVFVPGDEVLLDLILACWVAILDCQKAEGKEVEGVAEVVGALVGG
jgi:hypothetical protein